MIQDSHLILYQFPISHYCEKARWALQFKKAVFRQINVPPGLHKIIIKCKAPSAKSPITVPLLIADNQIIQGSGPIIDYMDRSIREKPLGFDEEHLQKDSADMEMFLDETIASLFHSIAYNILLKDQKSLISFWGLDGPFYTKAWLTFAVPYLARLIKQMYKTDAVYIADYKNRFNVELDRLDRLCESKPFLLGNRFSRCDLTMAAILAPLNFPKEHPYPNPVPFPDEFQLFCEGHIQRPVLQRVAELYREYRHRS